MGKTDIMAASNLLLVLCMYTAVVTQTASAQDKFFRCGVIQGEDQWDSKQQTTNYIPTAHASSTEPEVTAGPPSIKTDGSTDTESPGSMSALSTVNTPPDTPGQSSEESTTHPTTDRASARVSSAESGDTAGATLMNTDGNIDPESPRSMFALSTVNTPSDTPGQSTEGATTPVTTDGASARVSSTTPEATAGPTFMTTDDGTTDTESPRSMSALSTVNTPSDTPDQSTEGATTSLTTDGTSARVSTTELEDPVEPTFMTTDDESTDTESPGSTSALSTVNTPSDIPGQSTERATASPTADRVSVRVSSTDPEDTAGPTFMTTDDGSTDTESPRSMSALSTVNTPSDTPGKSTERATTPPTTVGAIVGYDCYDIRMQGHDVSGEYTVAPPGWDSEAFIVHCNNSIDAGGWTIIQRRMFIPSLVSFDQDWDSYKHGFGNLSGGYWLGNEKVAFLTNRKRYELRIDLVNEPLDAYHAKYDDFRISDESDNYRIVDLGSFSGTAGIDQLGAYRNMSFTTYDRDNDHHHDGNCAERNNGGWWYNECSGHVWAWLNEGHDNKIGYWWQLPKDPDLMYSEMKIRQIQGE